MRRQWLWLAAELGVDRPGSLLQWLVRIFFLPGPDGGSSARGRPGLATRLLEPAGMALGVRCLQNPWEWFLRAFVLPRSSPGKEFLPGVGRIRLPGWLRDWYRAWLGHIQARLRHARARLAPERVAVGLERAGRATIGASRPIQVLCGALTMVCLGISISTPLTNQEQPWFFLATWVAAYLVNKLPGRLSTLILMMVSVLATVRYGYWRLTHTLDLETGTDLFFGLLLLGAEIYSWLILLLGFIQTIAPLGRKPVPLPGDTRLWPTVDVFIPSYNEPLKVVKPTVFAAQGMDWPRDKLRIYLLDDGCREEFRKFADQVGVGYIIRDNNRHAKAGNLNHALNVTQGEFIAIFDCDHVPARSFLQIVMGEFMRDPKCALVQTPHHFFSADPFERNLGVYRDMPNENALFNRLVQDGNDLWNAAFFCGSCAVIKRLPLEEIGGIATETVTEDAHTALKLHRNGYNSAYMNVPQAAGLATESLSSHIGQRIRWARGMIQIFRVDNPLFGPGLSFFQRLCYSNAMLHFLHGIPRLVFLVAPSFYLLFELHIIHAETLTFALYALPHLAHANLTNARIQGRYRHTLWAGIYETVLAWYIVLPTTLALINPRFGKFNVTPKGGVVEKQYFDWTISTPYLSLLLLSILELFIGIGRLFWWNAYESDVVLLNLAWLSLNLITLGVALGVSSETRQLRETHRVPTVRRPATLYMPDGRTWICETLDYSTAGLGLALPSNLRIDVGQRVRLSLGQGDREFSFSSQVVTVLGQRVGLSLAELSLEQEAKLTRCTFGRADAWHDWHRGQSEYQTVRSFQIILTQAGRGYARLFRHLLEPWLGLERAPLPRGSRLPTGYYKTTVRRLTEAA